jgi:hypothetical protein
MSLLGMLADPLVMIGSEEATESDALGGIEVGESPHLPTLQLVDLRGREVAAGVATGLISSQHFGLTGVSFRLLLPALGAERLESRAGAGEACGAL